MAKAKKTQSKSNAQKGGLEPMQADPPVLVGGGGSVRVTFKNDPTEQAPPNGWRRRFRRPEDIVRIVIHDGIDAANDKDIPVAGTWYVKCFDR